jgi:hypothetical protein
MTGKCPCGAAVVSKGKCRRCYARSYYASQRRARTHESAPAQPAQLEQPARHVELDALLSEWRQANAGSIVQVGQSGVVLHRLCDSPLRFGSADEAIEYLTRPTPLAEPPSNRREASESRPAARERISVEASDRREYMRLYQRARRARLARARDGRV